VKVYYCLKKKKTCLFYILKIKKAFFPDKNIIFVCVLFMLNYHNTLHFNIISAYIPFLLILAFFVVVYFVTSLSKHDNCCTKFYKLVL